MSVEQKASLVMIGQSAFLESLLPFAESISNSIYCGIDSVEIKMLNSPKLAQYAKKSAISPTTNLYEKDAAILIKLSGTSEALKNAEQDIDKEFKKSLLHGYMQKILSPFLSENLWDTSSEELFKKEWYKKHPTIRLELIFDSAEKKESSVSSISSVLWKCNDCLTQEGFSSSILISMCENKKSIQFEFEVRPVMEEKKASAAIEKIQAFAKAHGISCSATFPYHKQRYVQDRMPTLVSFFGENGGKNAKDAKASGVGEAIPDHGNQRAVLWQGRL